MSPIITYILLVFLSLFALFIIFELYFNRNVKSFLVQTFALLIVFAFLNLTTGFPETIIVFGGVTPLFVIGVLFICVLTGIFANYFFYRKGKFELSAFLKPLVISPIVLLPLIGSVQKTTEFDTVQIISFGVLAFQNGFFWKEVFFNAKG